MEIFAFCVITLKQIRIYTCYASQYDCLNHSFVKDEHTYSKKWPEIVVERSFMSNFHFETVFRTIPCSQSKIQQSKIVVTKI